MSAEEEAEKQRSKALEQKMNQDQQQDEEIKKLLLLGAGESGKSTLFKQMIQIYGKGFPEDERRTYTPIIHNNIISSMKVLCSQAPQYGGVSEENEDIRKMVDEELKGDEEIDMKLGGVLQKLWVDAGIRKTYDHRSNFQLNDSTMYFCSKLDEIMKPDYIPSEQDVLRSRVRTTGIVENAFDIDGTQFKMFDVGGQRNERKKWIHCFENVTAVLFVAAISEYDQVLYEDENTNRITEALNLFEEIANSRWFRDTSMILFMNKRDLFADKIKKVPLSKFFPEFKGGDNYEEACSFMEKQFTSRSKNPNKKVYPHITCATDTTNVAAVFNAVKDIIINKSLEEAGL